MAKRELKLSQEDIMNLLDKLYDNSVDGIPKVSRPFQNWRMTI